jgi:hypothetical protein
MSNGAIPGICLEFCGDGECIGGFGGTVYKSIMAVETTRIGASRALPARAFTSLLAITLACACGGGAGADGDPDFAPPFSGAGTGNAAGGQVGVSPNGSNTAGAPSNLGAGGANATQPNAQNGGNTGVSQGGSGNALGGAGGATTAMSGAGGQGGAQVPPPPTDFGEGIFFADNFEAGINAAWRNTSNSGTIVQDTTRGANGTSSSIRVDGNGGFHTMLQFTLPDSVRAANQFYGRVHLRVDQMPGNGHFVWVEAGTAVGDNLQGNDVNEMRIGYNIGLLQVNHYGGPNGGDQDIRDRNRQLTPGTWHCLQFFMNGNPEALQVWLDDEETALSTTNFTAQREGAEGNGTALVDWMPPFEAVRFGWELGSATIWYDEVALGDTLPACQ